LVIRNKAYAPLWSCLAHFFF